MVIVGHVHAQFVKAKMHQIRFRLGELIYTELPQTPIAGFRGLLLKEREGKERRAGEGGGRGKGKGFAPPLADSSGSAPAYYPGHM